MVSSAHGGGVYQDFASGTLAKSTTGDTFYAYRGIAHSMEREGSGGWQTRLAHRESLIDPVLGTVDQDFQYGTIFHNHVKWGSVGTNFVATARKMGLTTSNSAGQRRTSCDVTANGGGQYQTFTTGALPGRPRRVTTTYPRPIWTTVARRTAAWRGTKIGWPKAAPSATASSKTWKQSSQFERRHVALTGQGDARTVKAQASLAVASDAVADAQAAVT